MQDVPIPPLSTQPSPEFWCSIAYFELDTQVRSNLDFFFYFYSFRHLTEMFRNVHSLYLWRINFHLTIISFRVFTFLWFIHIFLCYFVHLNMLEIYSCSCGGLINEYVLGHTVSVKLYKFPKVFLSSNLLLFLFRPLYSNFFFFYLHTFSVFCIGGWNV